jgi:hypothetical protein
LVCFGLKVKTKTTSKKRRKKEDKIIKEKEMEI